MHSIKSFRPQNQHPDALIRCRKELAQQNKEAVRTTVQAMQRRKMAPSDITVRAVAKEAGVSVATIYRGDELFALVKKANPALRRRETEQIYRDDLARAREETSEVLKEKNYHKKKAELAEIGSLRLQQEIMQLRKKNLELQSENSYLKELVAQCTCGSKELHTPRPLQ